MSQHPDYTQFADNGSAHNSYSPSHEQHTHTYSDTGYSYNSPSPHDTPYTPIEDYGASGQGQLQPQYDNGYMLGVHEQLGEVRVTKHLDTTRGQFYYYNHDTQITSWDPPLEDVPLYFSDEQVMKMKKLHQDIADDKAAKSQARLEIIETMMDDRQLAKMKEDADHIAKVNRNSLNEWNAGLMIAANEGYDCNMSWKSIPRIEPVLYDFEQNYGHRLRALRLVGLQLTELPEALGPSLQGLEVLNVSNNKLRTLPDNIIYMTSLTQLSVLHNDLESLPDRIGLLCSIRRLEISNNKLKALPDTFAALTHLKRLDLESNCLRLLPENLDLMVKLESLNVNKNRLLRLPRCLHRMKALTLLSANKNNISYIPNDLVKSRTIETVRLCNNELTALPERLGEMLCLKELALDFNLLSFLPMTFYMLENLSRLRIEGNPALCSPGDDVITGGAKSVVTWCRARFLDDEQSRMRRIIFTVQDSLRQLHLRGLADLTKFDDEFYWKDDISYAFDMDWLFEYVVPTMNRTWAREANMSRHNDRRRAKKRSKKGIDNNMLLLQNSDTSGSEASPTKKRDLIDETIINDFPFTRPEVMWAITHFFDANGPVYTQGKVFFKRCGCTDSNGRRFPCVPPKKGYMCNRRAYILKKEIVLKKERERRAWAKMKKAAILEAGMRAEQDAIEYLESDAGVLWVTEMSYMQGEDVVENKGLDAIVHRRREACEKKKKKVIDKFEKRKKKVKAQLVSKSTAIEKQLNEAKELLLTAKEGYIREATHNRVVMLSEQLSQFPEHEQLLCLQDQCAAECVKIEDEYFKGSSSDEGNDTAGEDSAEDNFWETPSERAAREEREAREVKALAIRSAGQDTGGQTKADRDAQRKEEKRAWRELKKKRANAKKLKREKYIQKMKRQYKYIIDRVQLKYSRLKLIANGDFSEAQKELQYHIFQAYIKTNVARARRAAEREYLCMGRIRRQWDGLGLETSFFQWKDYVKYMRSERRKDARRKWRQEVKNFESSMICVHLAEAQISMWKKSTDIYTDTPYWKNWQSGDVSWVEPKLETYMPLGFKFPDAPAPLPDGVGEHSTDPSDQEEEADDTGELDFLTVVKSDDIRAATAGSDDDGAALKGRSKRAVVSRGTSSRSRKRRVIPGSDDGQWDEMDMSELGTESRDITGMGILSRGNSRKGTSNSQRQMITNATNVHSNSGYNNDGPDVWRNDGDPSMKGDDWADDESRGSNSGTDCSGSSDSSGSSSSSGNIYGTDSNIFALEGPVPEGVEEVEEESKAGSDDDGEEKMREDHESNNSKGNKGTRGKRRRRSRAKSKIHKSKASAGTNDTDNIINLAVDGKARPLLLRVDSDVSSIPDEADVGRDIYSNIEFPPEDDDEGNRLGVDTDELSTTSSPKDPSKRSSKGIGMDGNFQPRRWPISGKAEYSLSKSMSFGAAHLDPMSPLRLDSNHYGRSTSDLQNQRGGEETPKKVSFSPMNSNIGGHIDDDQDNGSTSGATSNPFNSIDNSYSPVHAGMPMSERKVIVAPTNSLGVVIHPGAGRMQTFTESFSYGPDSLRAGVLLGRMGRPIFQEEVVETEEEKKRRLMKEKTAEAARNAASTSTLLSSLSGPGGEGGHNNPNSGNAQEMLDALEGGSDLSEVGARARLAEVKAQIKQKHATEINRAKIGLKQKEKDVNHVRHQTYMKQRNRRPRMGQGMFDERVKKEVEEKYFEPAGTFALLNMAGGNYDMTRESPMDVMSALATKAVQIRKKLRANAEKEELMPKKESRFFHDHIDVILREDYISSDEEEHELANKIKEARLNTARQAASRQRTGNNRLQTGGSVKSSGPRTPAVGGGDATIKLPAITSKTR